LTEEDIETVQLGYPARDLAEIQTAYVPVHSYAAMLN